MTKKFSNQQFFHFQHELTKMYWQTSLRNFDKFIANGTHFSVGWGWMVKLLSWGIVAADMAYTRKSRIKTLIKYSLKTRMKNLNKPQPKNENDNLNKTQPKNNYCNISHWKSTWLKKSRPFEILTQTSAIISSWQQCHESAINKKFNMMFLDVF